MENAILVVLPVAGLALLGFACVKVGYISQDGADGVARFAAVVAIPLLAFRTIRRTGWPANIDNTLEIIGSFYGAALLILIVVMVLALLFFRSHSSDAWVTAIGSSHGSVVLLGIPAVLMIAGDKVGQPLFFLVALHCLVMAILVSLVATVTEWQLSELFSGIWAAVAEQIRNPLLLGVLLGLLWNYQGLPLPAPVDGMIGTLAAVAGPVALFGFGGVVARYPITGILGRPMVISVFKLGLNPLLVWLIATRLFSLPASWIWAAVVLAAMPTMMGADATGERPEQSGGGAVGLSALLAVGSLAALVYIMRTF